MATLFFKRAKIFMHNVDGKFVDMDEARRLKMEERA